MRRVLSCLFVLAVSLVLIALGGGRPRCCAGEGGYAATPPVFPIR